MMDREWLMGDRLMGMLTEFARALVMAGPVVFLFSFGLAWWGLRRGMFSETGGVDALDREIKAMGKLKGDERPRSNLVHEKWLKFGGGFYGVVGLITYAWVEAGEIMDLLAGLRALVLQFDLGVLVNFFVDSFKNFITAIAWPAYWLSRVASSQPWLWFIAAYAGYWAGVRVAQAVFTRRSQDDL